MCYCFFCLTLRLDQSEQVFHFLKHNITLYLSAFCIEWKSTHTWLPCCSTHLEFVVTWICSTACKISLFFFVVFKRISNRWLSLRLHFQHMNSCFYQYLLLDSPALISAAIFSKEKIRLNLQNFQISFAGFPVSWKSWFRQKIHLNSLKANC